MLPRLSPMLDEIAHELAHQLGSGPVRRGGFGHEGVAEFSFQLDGENGFLRHCSPES
jgi:hypothetical protein